MLLSLLKTKFIFSVPVFFFFGFGVFVCIFVGFQHCVNSVHITIDVTYNDHSSFIFFIKPRSIHGEYHSKHHIMLLSTEAFVCSWMHRCHYKACLKCIIYLWFSYGSYKTQSLLKSINLNDHYLFHMTYWIHWIWFIPNILLLRSSRCGYGRIWWNCSIKNKRLLLHVFDVDVNWWLQTLYCKDESLTSGFGYICTPTSIKNHCYLQIFYRRNGGLAVHMNAETVVNKIVTKKCCLGKFESQYATFKTSRC